MPKKPVHYSASKIRKPFFTGLSRATLPTFENIKRALTHLKLGWSILAKSLALDWAGFACVNSVSPDYIKTPISAGVPKEFGS
jgi:NAD(P)-dependent dehydrogenase (short-subunit alcohol dehydrogenase family)